MTKPDSIFQHAWCFPWNGDSRREQLNAYTGNVRHTVRTDFPLQSVAFERQNYTGVSWRRRTLRRCCKAVLLIVSGVQRCISKRDEKTAPN